MKLIQFIKNGRTHVGTLSESGVILDITEMIPTVDSMKAFLESGEQVISTVKKADNEGQHTILSSDVKIIAPITNPGKIVCIGMNYKDHCEELGVPIPTAPVVFYKFSNCIIGSGQNITKPMFVEQLDWEVELGFVIGKAGKNISEEDAMNHVAGFTVVHDVTARDWVNKNGCMWLLAQALDTFLPIGPAIVTKDSISDPHNLGIRSRVNGVTMQDSNTKNLIFKTEKIITYVSQFFSLQPGDLFITGTPPGVGFFRKPPILLKDGDEVECEIDEIGLIKNKVVVDIH